MATNVFPLKHRLETAFATREQPTEARQFYTHASQLPVMQQASQAAASRKSDHAIMLELYLAGDYEALDAFAPAT